MPGCETLSYDACIWPSIGCLLDLGQQPTDLLSGTFAAMPTYSALAEYEAAAIADATAGPATPDQSPAYGAPGGLSVGASNAALGKYISDQALPPVQRDRDRGPCPRLRDQRRVQPPAST